MASVAGMLHAIRAQGALTPTWTLAIVLFPVFGAVPPFRVALVAAVALSRRSRSTG